MHKKNHCIAICLLLLSSAAYSASADRFANVTMQAQHVSGSVHMLQGAGGNIGVSVGPDGTLIVDDQFAPLADKIIAALQGLGGGLPKLVLNTHFHGDHTGSNPTMGKSGTIISHHNVRVRLLNEEDFPRSGLPLVTFDKTLLVHFNDEKIELIHLPNGHTDGDAVVWFKTANVIHMGDHFFKERFPFVDVASGGNIDGFIANVERVAAQLPDDVKVIPGHGTLSTKAELLHTTNAVKGAAALVRKALAGGDSIDKTVAALEQQYPNYGSGFISAARWVDIVKADGQHKR